ncbi:MAG: peptidylprolyl isomerase [Clostridiales bacterium]|nr:peptidylprolyl isomerase [Clostridiales bacterium]
MKKVVCLVLVLLLTVFSGCGSGGEKVKETESPAPESYPPMTGIHHVEIEVADYGVISVELDGDTAPITVGNFIGLAESGFYDGLTLHRIISGFMIQGGDPEGTGYGGSENTIKGEFSVNKVENNISHLRGVISMARSDVSYDSASSQFFIVHQDSAFLDGAYAAFGHVTSGMDIVDRICEDTPVQDKNGTVYKADQPVITSVKVID